MKVLFVCVENSCRSQMAEGFARRHGGGVWEAHSAGSRPSGTIHARAAELMRECGIDISGQASKSLDALPQTEWDCIVTMGCGDACPHLPARQRVDWALPDPKAMEVDRFRQVRDEIERRVLELRDQLSAGAES